MSRLSSLTEETMTAAQKKVAEAIEAGPRGKLSGPFVPLAHCPGVAGPVQELGAYLRWNGTLPAKLRELAILVTARFWGAQYEWYAHHKHALEAGLDPAIAEAIAAKRRPDFKNRDEEIVYDYATELHTRHSVDDATYAAAKDLLGEESVVELTVLCGYYTIISMTLNTFQVPVPEGIAPPLED